MRASRLGSSAALAALAAVGSPAAAQHWSDPDVGAAAGVAVHRASDLPIRRAPAREDRRFERRRDRDRGPDVAYVTGTFGGEWARWNNRSWEPSSYNDWWHDRPDRAFPRWMQSNQDCQRQWQGGGVWRC
jgi:hypothetical protein